MQKIKSFEYLVKRLLEWYRELNPGLEKNDLNRLKVLKLHFFVSAVNASAENDGLLDIFNNFYAMPYGHVESDIYSNIDNFENMKIDRDGLLLKEYPSNYFDDVAELIPRIDDSIKSLKKINNNLINYKALDLVNLSHSWYSWRLVFNYAKQQGSFSSPIPAQIIKEEPKIFQLELFS